jgi:hypothetical protein
MKPYVIKFVSDLLQVGGYFGFYAIKCVSDLLEVGGYFGFYAIKCVSDLLEVGGYFRFLDHYIAEILLKVVLYNITPNLTHIVVGDQMSKGEGLGSY